MNCWNVVAAVAASDVDDDDDIAIYVTKCEYISCWMQHHIKVVYSKPPGAYKTPGGHLS